MKPIPDWKYLLLIGLVALLTVSIWFRNGHQLGTAEGGLPFNNLQRHADVFRYTWADTNLGNSTGYLVAAFPTYLILSLFEKISIPAFIIEAIVFWIILTSAGLGMYKIAKNLLKISSAFSLIAVIFYWLSPFVLVNIWGRFLYNHIFFFALLPLGLYFFLNGLITRSFRQLLYVVLTILIFSYSLTALALTILLLAVFTFGVLYFFVTDPTVRGRVFYIKYLALFVCLFVLTNFWWISQFFSFGASANFNNSISAFFTTEGNVSALSQTSSKLGSFIDLTRFIHYSFFYDGASIWAQAFIGKLALLINSVILLVTFIGLFMARRHRLMLFFSLLYLFSLFLAKGNNPPFGEIYTFFFIKSSLLQTFRNPIEKIGIITVLSSALLFSYTVEIFSKSLIKKFKVDYFLPYAILCIVGLFWGWPFFSGLIFTGYKNQLGEIFSYETQVPSYYQEAEEYLKNNPDYNRLLVAPLLGEGVTYNWSVPYTGIDLYSTLFSKQNIALNTTIPFYYDIVSNVVNYQFSPQIIRFLPLLAVDGLLIRRDVDTQNRPFPTSNDIQTSIDNLVKQQYLKPDRQFGKLSLYTVSPTLKWGKFYLTNQIIYSNEKDFSRLRDLNDLSKYAVVDTNIDIESIPPPVKTVITPTETNFYYWLEKYQKQTDADIYAQLLYVKHSPDDVLYPFVRSKEFLTSFLYTDYPKWVLYMTNLLGKRAVEICQYQPTQSTGISKDDLINQYKLEYLDLMGHIKNITGQRRELKDDIFYSLAAQAVLLSRCEKIPYEFYRETFIDIGLISKKSSQNLNFQNQSEINFEIPFEGEYQFKSVETDFESTERLNKGKKTVVYPKENIYINQTILTGNNIEINRDLALNQEIKFDDYNSEYDIRFEYVVEEGDFFGFFIKQDFDINNYPLVFRGIPVDKGKKEYDFTFTPSLGSKKARLGFTGNKNLFCTHGCKAIENQLKARITNLRVTKRSLKRPMFTLEQNVPPVSSNVNWIKLSPVEYQVNITKLSNAPEILVFSELYSTGWVIKDHNLEHLLVNGYANGWKIETPGSYKFTVRYQPQNKLNAAYFVTIVSTILVVSLLFYQRKSQNI